MENNQKELLGSKGSNAESEDYLCGQRGHLQSSATKTDTSTHKQNAFVFFLKNGKLKHWAQGLPVSLFENGSALC